mgnify:CR=1 FL=1
MTDRYDFSEIEDIIRLGLREQSIHPQGLNSSQTHRTLYPVGDERNEESLLNKEPLLSSSKLMRTGIGSRRNWA